MYELVLIRVHNGRTLSSFYGVICLLFVSGCFKHYFVLCLVAKGISVKGRLLPRLSERLSCSVLPTLLNALENFFRRVVTLLIAGLPVE